jgi:bifunctional non-homologous end joining protein LigD
MADKLSDYQQKRDFARTPEPRDNGHESDAPAFVVQKHAASSLHYDVRLEIKGVLKSWAVPKGPSLNPSQKRLAMETEDHPLSYADFEGRIPEEEYGGGNVIVWDQGTYTHDPENEGAPDPKRAYEHGEIKFHLKGQKLKGQFVLVKTGQQQNSWLLIKKTDKYANTQEDILTSRPESVLSGKAVEEVEQQ